MTKKGIIQLIFFLFFLTLLISATDPLQTIIPVDLFFRLDPLIALVTLLGSGILVPGVLLSVTLLIGTLLFGRFFCGYVCPMGGLIDASDRTFFPRIGRGSPHWAKRGRAFKYYILIMVLLSALLGLVIVHFFDPITLLTRTLTFLLYPLLLFLGEETMTIIRPLADRMGWMEISYASFTQKVYGMGWVTFILVGVILFLGRVRHRFWCRYLCPLGALLSLFGRFGIYRRRVNDRCTACGLCQKGCPMGAIADDPQITAPGECILCRSCAGLCPEGAISFRPSSTRAVREERAFQLTRRGLILSLTFGAIGAFLARSDPARGQIHGRLIRPPGAIPEPKYLNRCIRCGECMKVCITNTLQPALFEAGLEGLWTPKMHLRLAPCEQQCNLCGQVCPTRAIRPLDLEERRHAKVGTAILKRESCLVWEQDRLCLICDEICPYDAITFRWVEGLKRPFVLENRCNGCGQCEKACPIQGDSAIVVVPMAELRLAKGSYVEEAKRLKYEFAGARTEELSPEERLLYKKGE
jgi:ferredoxin-type protein NapF